MTGTVTDASTKAAVTGANVTLAAPSGTFRTRTDAKGQFSLLGVPVDTYTLSIEAQGYDPITQQGVTVIGDQNLDLGSVTVSKQLRTIGRVATRSVSSAYQPNQTVDSITINQNRIATTAGRSSSTNENALVLSAPGVTLSDTGNPTIRGSLRTEVGFQFDGVPITEPFFSTNGTNNHFSGAGSVQVVEGSGDATQGNNVGGGVINVIPKRGTYPGFGYLDAEIGAPNAYHQGQIEYGIATRDQRISDYFTYTQSQQHPYEAPYGQDPTQYGNYYAPAYTINKDFINNFVFRFGHNNGQSLQFLYENRSYDGYGLAGGVYYNGPNPTQYWQTDPRIEGLLGYNTVLGSSAAIGTANLLNLLPTLPGQNINVPPVSNPEDFTDPTQVVKFEYDNQIDANDFLDLKLYNVGIFQVTNDYFAQNGTVPLYQNIGGRRSGVEADFTHQFGSVYTMTFNTQLEDQHPVWDGYEPTTLYNLMAGLPAGGSVGANGFAIAGQSANTSYANSGAAPSLADFLTPVNGVCPVAGGCYLSNYLSGSQKLPIGGINYNGTQFKTFGLGLRNQIQVAQNLKLDLGLRYDGAEYRYGPNPYNPNPLDLNNPSDVDPSTLGNKFTDPRVLEPRLAAAFQIDRSDAVRIGYGRSAVFLNAQTSGTPGALYNAAALQNVPALDTAANPRCGSGANPAGFFKCQNYAEQLYWLWDQNNDAPDLGNTTAEVDSNYDLTYQHQFKGGYGLRMTPFYHLSLGNPSFAIKSETTDPNTGAILSEVFTANNSGIVRATGLETEFTTPDVRYGFEGFVSATYQNVLTSVPPLISGEDSLPIIGSGSLVLGDVYRAGYVSPFSMRIGGDYKFKNGLRINPVLQYNVGYPYTVGTTTASTSVINGAFANVPQSNNGAAINTVSGYTGATGGQLATQYIDPANPGNAAHPNIAATRGTPATSSAGGVLSPANLEADLTIEYKTGRSTFGVYATNLFGSPYNGAIPLVNPYYQPVATGVSGPQTGQLKQANPAYDGGIYQQRGYANVPTNANAFTNAAYLLLPTNPFSLNFYYQFAL